LGLAQAHLHLARSKSQTGLGPRTHALTTEFVCVLIHPSSAHAVLPGDIGGRQKRGLKTVQRLKLLRDESR
jgi:hypothetical protein